MAQRPWPAFIPALALLLALLGGCGGGDDNEPPANDTTAPSVPQGFTATADSATSVQLAWTASTDSGSGVAGYRHHAGGVSFAENAEGELFLLDYAGTMYRVVIDDSAS